MSNGIKAIETRYDGCHFRSRLEARWAVFFNTLGVKWEYEKEGYDLGAAGWYLPDFWLPKFDCWMEVKGEKPTPSDAEKIEALRLLAMDEDKNGVLLAIGQIGNHVWSHSDDGGWDSVTVLMDDDKHAEFIARMFGSDRRSAPGMGLPIYCPVCGSKDIYLDGMGLSPFEFNEIDGGCILSQRFWCNTATIDSWTVNTCSTRNGTSIFITDVSTSNEPFIMAGQSWKRYNAAIETARSARFEHGETPRTGHRTP